MKKRAFIVICFILSFCIGLTGCNGTDTGNVTASPTATETPEPTPSPSPSPAGFRTIYPNDQQRFINFAMMGFSGVNYPTYALHVDKYMPLLNSNVADIWACWYNIEMKKGEYDFKYYDKLIDKIAAQGVKVYLRINTMDMPSWLYMERDEKGRSIYTQWDYEGKDIINSSYTGGSRAGFISYANEEARKYALDFTRAVVEHFTERYKNYPGGNPIYMYASNFSHCGEMEYYFGGSSSDYSPAAIAAFRNWLKNRYADINLLNERWGTKYTSFDQAEAPMITDNTATVQEMDWLEYRAYEQGRIIKDQAEIVKSIDPDAYYVMVFGSVFDHMIKKRGTLFADYWADYVDWIGVADAWNYPHRYSMSVVRGISKGKGFYNEAFIESRVNKELREEFEHFTHESFDEGANQMNYAGFMYTDVGEKQYDYYEIPGEYIKDNQKVVRPKPDRAIYMSTWSL
ncbi:MAG TPA: beta-galactosidase, partial [Clostridia bacterium]|nr:beta-galactosidase [Clostridia bacterium]